MPVKRLMRGLCALLGVIVLAGCGSTSQPGAAEKDSGSPVAGKKVAYIMQMAPSEIFEMWSQSAQETAEGLGMEYDAFFCGGSDEQWRDTITQCAAQGYDGLLLSHGGQDYAYTFLKDLLEQYPELKIVTFDTQFQDSDGRTQTLEGVTQFFQRDVKLTQLLLEYVRTELYPNKAAEGKAINVLKVWVGPGFLSAFDRRQEGYVVYEEQGLIHTVETIGPEDFTDAERSMAQVTADTLARYEPGEIDVIWCCYDLYANGVYTALTQGGYDIPMVSVDICNGDIEKMAGEGSPWKACATTNWNYNGEFGMRVLALELTGDYNAIIDPMTWEPASWLELPTTVVTQDMVSGGGIDVTNLDTVAGKSYTDRSWMPTTDWMAELLGD